MNEEQSRILISILTDILLTMKDIQKWQQEFDDVVADLKININMEVCTVEGFSGHCDRSQLLAYIRNLSNPPKKIIVNHGEREGSVDFAKFVSSKYRITSSAPKNLECVRLH